MQGHDTADPVEQVAIAAAVALVDAGGLWPNRRDGSVFANRQGKLPMKALGFCLEYTVPISGMTARGVS